MSGILVAAAVASLLAVAVLGPLIAHFAPAGGRRALVIALLVMLPMQPLAFYLARMPLHAGVSALLGDGTALRALSLFYAPVTEEAAKWLVLLVPAVHRALTRERAVALALATGLGFGIGEIWFLAERLSRSASIAALTFWQFGGFYVERLLVCFLHGAFVVVLFVRQAQGHSAWPGALFGLVVHFALNLPILFIALDLFGLGRDVWSAIVFGWLLTATAALAVLVAHLAGRGFKRTVLGRATCPSCGTVYDRPWLAANLGWKRYERCPACRKWHLV
jgi:hypothetical protein